MKIALIAMSGIRVCDAELLRLGLTLPGFVERSKTIASLPSLGLLTLAGMTPAEHDVEYFEVPDLLAAEELFNSGFDIAGISSYSAQISQAYELADQLGEKGITVVMGGLHVTALPEEALQHCDCVVAGHGEVSWSKVLADFQRNDLKKIYNSKGSEFNFTPEVMPSFEMLDISKYNRLTVQASRGCVHHCKFCASSVLLTDRYIQKPLQSVINEIDSILEIWEHPFIEFADDNAFVNKQYWKELLGKLKSKHIKWFAETDISVSQDNELLTLMRQSGCSQVLIGLESPTKDALKDIDERDDWKSRQFEHYKQAVNNIQSHGITVNGCFIIGLDGHGPEIFDKVYDYVKELELYEVQVTIQTPFPGTALYEQLKQQNRLIEPENWGKCTLFDLNYTPSAMTCDELTNGFRKLVTKLYSEEFTKYRRDNFKKFLRNR